MANRAALAATIGSAAALALAGAPAAAQSVNDYRLPGTTTTAPNPRAQGPVDPDAPVVRTPQPTPTPTITPSAAPPPPAATPSRQPAARPSAAPPSAQSSPSGAAPRPAVSPTPDAPAESATTSALPPFAAPQPSAAAPLDSSIPAASPSPAAASEPEGGAGIWPWIAGLMAIVAAGFAALWWRREREDREPFITFVPPVVRASKPEAEPMAAPPAPEVPPPAHAPVAPVPAVAPANVSGIEMALEATRMNASLMATTLNYKLVITNRGAQVLSGLAVEGDMISAHSSLPADQQVANDTHKLEPRHALVQLAPGESAEFSGDFRLPLTAVTPIRAGDAAYFVPLARLRVRAETPGGLPLVSAQTFVVGELPEQDGAALRPFRLDLGPRTYSKIGQRAVS